MLRGSFLQAHSLKWCIWGKTPITGKTWSSFVFTVLMWGRGLGVCTVVCGSLRRGLQNPRKTHWSIILQLTDQRLKKEVDKKEYCLLENWYKVRNNYTLLLMFPLQCLTWNIKSNSWLWSSILAIMKKM